ncbi:hypothetical protein OY671_010582, partial [Metschnikowia pulcherrima]
HARRHVQREEGRNADRHGDDAERDARGRHRHPPRQFRRGAADRRKGRLPGAQRGRRPARASHASAAGRADHPPCAEARPRQRPERPARDDSRGHPAQPCGPLQHPGPDRAGSRCQRSRAARADARRDRGDGRDAVPRFRRGAERRASGHDASAPAGTHERPVHPLPPRIPAS